MMASESGYRKDKLTTLTLKTQYNIGSSHTYIRRTNSSLENPDEEHRVAKKRVCQRKEIPVTAAWEVLTSPWKFRACSLRDVI